MHRTLKLIENGTEVTTRHSDHNDQINDGLNEDMDCFIQSIEDKKQVEIKLKPDAKKIGQQIGSNIRKALTSNPEKSYKLGKAIGEKIAGKA